MRQRLQHEDERGEVSEAWQFELGPETESLGEGRKDTPEQTLADPAVVADEELSAAVDFGEDEVVAADHGVESSLVEEDVGEADEEPREDDAESEVDEEGREVAA